MTITTAVVIIAILLSLLVGVTAWACAMVAGDVDRDIDEHEQAKKVKE